MRHLEEQRRQQRPDVGKPQVHSLPGKRMNDMRRIAHQCPLRDRPAFTAFSKIDKQSAIDMSDAPYDGTAYVEVDADTDVTTGGSFVLKGDPEELHKLTSATFKVVPKV